MSTTPGIGRTVRGGLSLAALALGSACVSPDASIGETYARIELTNTLSMVRENEPVEIPLSEVRSRFKAFDERDFSVHLLPARLYPGQGDPLLATDPAPEIPAQLVDTNLDGTPDAILVICDFAAGERRHLAVASPRFTRLAKQIGPRLSGGLWTRETITREGGTLRSQGRYVEVSSAVLDPAHSKGDGLYQCDGPILETDTCAFRLLFDSRMCLDVIGKRERGLFLCDSNPEFVAGPIDLSGTEWGGSLLGDAEGFGAGAFGYAEKGTAVPIAGFDSAQYRIVKDGPAATECEILLLGARIGRETFDLRWRIRHYAGTRVLRHDVNVSRGGHGLAFAISASGVRKESPSGQLGWLRASSFGPTNVTGGKGGSLGLGIVANARTANGFVKNPADAIGVGFDSSARNVTFYTVAAWDQEPAGLRSAQDFVKEIDQLATRLETPIRIANLEKEVRY
jgi:hypothetical protein